MSDPAAPRSAVILVNLGSTAAPTVPALRRFLGEFLSDRRVVDMPRFLWYPILYGIILTFRPRKLTGKYTSIWMTATSSSSSKKTHAAASTPSSATCERFQSPLMVYTTSLAQKLERALAALNADTPKQPHIIVRDAMTYGEYHRVDDVLTELHQTFPTVTDVVVLPLFAQYTSTTVACIFDTFFRYYGDPHRRCLPGLQLIRDYPTQPVYIEAIGQSLFRALKTLYTPSTSDTPSSWLSALRASMPTLAIVVSFHSIPCSYAADGDDYVSRCEATVTALQNWLECALAAAAQAIDGNNNNAPSTAWCLKDVLLHVYQSQFGNAPWLGPSLETAMAALPSAPDVQADKAPRETVRNGDKTATTSTKAKKSAGATSAPLSPKDALVHKLETFYADREARAETWSTKQVADCLVLTPGFAVDCIETLVEVDEEARETFLEHGGKRFVYVPCLNDSDDHVRALTAVLKDKTRLPL